MNVGGVPLHEAGSGFWTVAAALISLTSLGALLVFRRGHKP
jgi:Mg2+ and Co2+ transporter CorA